MKKIITFTMAFLALIGNITFANAVECWPNWDGDYTVEATCDWPGDFKVYGNIYVGMHTITVETGDVVGVDLVNDKVTFTTGKMLFEGTAKMDNSVSSRYYRSQAYTNKGTDSNSSSNTNRTDCDASCTPCPTGTKAMNSARTGIEGTTVRNVSSAGTMYCAKVN